MAGDDRMIGHIEFRPPVDLQLYEIPESGVLRLDDEVLVAEVAVGELIVRHYGFATRWLAVNVTTDRSGRLVESSHDHFPFAVKCHLSTPMLREADTCWQIDLWLDVLVSADGRRHLVEDEDEFAEARVRELLSEREASGASEGLQDVLDLVRTGSLIDLLAGTCPFHASNPPEAQPSRSLDLNEYPALLPGIRPTW